MVTDNVRIASEAIALSSAASGASMRYDLSGVHDAALVVAITGNETGTVAIDVAGSTNATAAGSTGVANVAGFTLGGNATVIDSTAGGVRSLTLTMSSASTAGSGFTLSANEKTATLSWTNSTADLNSSAWSATAAYYGSTLGTTASGGLEAMTVSLATAIDYLFPGVFVKSTPSTAALVLRMSDKIAGAVGVRSTAAGAPSLSWQRAACRIAIDPGRSTAQYVGVNISTISTAGSAAVAFVGSQDYRKGIPVGRDVKWSS